MDTSYKDAKIAAWCAACLLALCAAAFAAPPPRSPMPAGPAVEYFEARVRPLLAEHCFPCHGPPKQRGGLRLDSQAALLTGSDNGAVVVAGKLDESALNLAIRYEGDTKMPPVGKLPPESLATLTSWVKMGVPRPNASAGGPGADHRRGRGP